jgi:gluconate transporter
MSKTLLLGLIIAIPAATIVGILFSRTNIVRNVNAQIPEGLVTAKVFKDDEMPGFGISIFSALVPVILMALSSVGDVFFPKSPAIVYLHFFGDAPIALLITVLISIFTLGIFRGRKAEEVMKSLGVAVKAIAMIILVIGAGGAFKQVIVDAGVGNSITALTKDLHVSPIILAWVIAAALRIALGSATVAIITASGIVLPMVAASGISPELMVLATSSGSVFASHVNDPGFWMFKEYFNIPVGQAIKVRTTYTCLLGVLGLIGVLALSLYF